MTAQSRSLTATSQGLDTAIKALTGKGWSKEELAEKVTIQGKKTTTGIGIATVKKFFSAKSVDRKYFVGICNALDLDWEAIAGLKTIAATPDMAASNPDIEALVKSIREEVHADIHTRCGTMRVLDMEQPIGIGDIYTSVNILEKLSGRRRLGLVELQQACDLENFDRFVLGQIEHERVPGLEAVKQYSQLLVLGKPGAGKTTFMKRLATLCNQGEFQTQRVPVFVTLKEFAEAKAQPGLQEFIAQQWHASRVKNLDNLGLVLEQGRALVLLDGLDEVQESEHDRVLWEIQGFTHQYRACQFVMTCRIAAREYTFQQFTEVEVADFDEAQIADFATKWFKTRQDPEKGERFIQRLEDNQPIQELATNPLLLTLLCLVFGEANDFPANRGELYKEGLDVLLKKWDAKRNIERDQVYKKLSLKRKEDLLSQLAFTTFEEGDYFFKQAVVEQHMVDYIRNLPGAHEDEEALQLDSEAVLKSIEAQHGLLVERAKAIYSFSHLTFQEYFAARQISQSTAHLSQRLADLAKHITEKRYREVFLLTVGMLPEADELLISMQQQVDALMADEPELQRFLCWLREKAESLSVPYKPAAVRAFYLSFARALSRDLSLDLDLALDRALSRDLSRDLSLSLSLDRALSRDLSLDLDLARALSLARALDRARARALDLARARALDLARALARALDLDLARDHRYGYDPELKLKIQALRSELPDLNDRSAFVTWWEEQGSDWVQRLRSAMIEHRNIGHDWQFTEAQVTKLYQYYDANKLLVNCLNSDCYVTKGTRQRIEETLLLPVDG